MSVVHYKLRIIYLLTFKLMSVCFKMDKHIINWLNSSDFDIDTDSSENEVRHIINIILFKYMIILYRYFFVKYSLMIPIKIQITPQTNNVMKNKI